MPNTIHGTTDTTGAVSISQVADKTVCIVGMGGAIPTMTVKKLYDIYGTTDATTKFGVGALSIDIVKILMANGVTSIKAMIPPPISGEVITKADQYDAAFTELMKSDIDIVLVDDADLTVLAKVKTHLDSAEAEDKFRYACVAAVATTVNSDFIATATAMNSKRIFCPAPIALNTSGANASHILLAAGLAAVLATETHDPALPMNGVEILGFGGLDRTLLKSERDALITGGIVPLTLSANSNPMIYRMVSTYTKDAQAVADPTWQECTTVLISDDVLASVEARIRANYKRTKNVARILSAIKTDVIDVLQFKNDLEIIENFDPKSVSVLKDPTDTYGALIDYSYDVVTPLYTITIKQHMKL